MLSEKLEQSSQNPLLLEATRRAIERRQREAADDPAKLANVALDDWQTAALRSRAQQMILLCARQTGKSTVTAFRALHKALYTRLSLTLLLSPSLRQSQELFRKVKDAYEALITKPATMREESALRAEFSNGSRIVALPGKEETIRGFSGVSLLIVDEASWVSDGLYYAIRPMLAVSGGEIILLSTPFGKRGFFFHEFTEGGVNWHRIKVTAYDCPRHSREFLEQERRSLPDFIFRSEYLCEFTETTDQVFSYGDIQRALDPEVKPLWGNG